MTNQELKIFLERENIKSGDKVRIFYSYDFPATWLNKEIVSSTLIKGKCTINTKTGPLTLPTDDEYLILFSEYTGVTGITAKYIDEIEVDGSRPMTIPEFYTIIKQKNIKSGDFISLVMIDDRILSNLKLLEINLYKDVDGDILVFVELPNGDQESIYLNAISKIHN